jgi:uncharacterized glyoxalase superfamily protein PhnB
MGLDIAHNDEEMLRAFELYQKAFGAQKIWEASPGVEPGSTVPGNLHIGIEIYGIEFLLHPVGYGEERKQAGGIWKFDSEDELHKVYDVLILEAQEYSMGSWPHAPVSANVTDKYGVSWWLHT